jgi:poly-gamma-glutamate capsule biosynthesis protein CapA/YwtB (metallophosphatase superfamily)
MNILISGDFYISDDFQNKDLINQTLIDLFQQADYRLVNLEAPITANEPKNKILKTGPHLRMSEDTVMPYLKQLKADAVTLANNHILDYGAKGLHDTFGSLKQNNIDYVGAGNHLKGAAQPLTLEKDGMRIAILNFCENEWSIAEADKPGANPMDIIDNVNQIKAAKATHDKVICVIHGGHEYYHLPSPRMQKQYRFYVDNGADAIVGHHTHCIGGYEIYNEAPIIYSLGNFLFTKPSKKDVWYEGLLCKLLIEKDAPIKFEIHPVNQQKNSFQTSLLKNHEIDTVLAKIQKLNNSITNDELLQKKWEEFVREKSKQYLSYVSPFENIGNKYIRAAARKFGLSTKFLNKEYLNLILNIIRCEAHYSILKKSINYKLKIK